MSLTSNPSGNGKDTTYKGGKDAPLVKLPFIVNEFSKYFKKFGYFVKTAKRIEKKYNIERDEGGFWEDEDIQRVWGKTTRLNTHSNRRKTLCLVTMLEMLRRVYKCPENKTQQDVESNSDNKSKEETCYIRIPLAVIEDDYDHSDDEQLPGTASQTKQPKNKPKYKLINAVPSLTKTTRKTSYVLQYNNHTRNATWAFEILNKDTLQKNALHSSNITEDRSVHFFYRTPPSEWNEVDHDRGHLAAARNHSWDQNAVNDANMISNIVPQEKTHNAGLWGKLEERCRKYAKGDARNVLVYTGPLYCSSKNYAIQKKAVPTALFKVVILEHENKDTKVECYIIPYRYDSKQLNDYIVSLEEIEKKSGLLFSKKMPTIQLNDELMTVQFKPPNEKTQNKEQQNKEKNPKGIQITLKVTPYNVLFGSIG